MSSQAKHKIARKLISVLLIVGVLIKLSIQNVYACTPAPETPWFIASVSLISTNLSNEFAEINPTDNNLILKNVSSDPIRIIIDGSYQEKNGYEELTTGQSATFSVNGNDDLSVNDYNITYLEPRNKFEDNRPANVEVPKPQIAWIQLLINDQSYYMQLQVSYAINPYYRSDSVYLYENGCINWSNQILFEGLVTPLAGFVLLVSLTIIIVSVIFIVKLRKRQ